MDFKNFVFVVALLCGAYSLVVSGFVLLDSVDEVQLNVRSELPKESLSTTVDQRINTYAEVIYALNYALPVGVVCVGLLIYLKRTNPVSMGLILLAVSVMAAAAMVTWKAGQQLEADGLTKLDRVVWWN